jgi:hypothetical protein
MTERKKRILRACATLKKPELPSASEKLAKKIDNDFLRTAIERAPIHLKLVGFHFDGT